MRDKVLLEVLLPATGAVYEFRVPYDMTVDEACGLMSGVLARREAAHYEAPPGGCDLMLRGGVEGAGDLLSPNELIRVLVDRGVLSDGVPVALV